MTRHRMTEADWQAIARVMFAIHQRRAAAGKASAPGAADARRERLRELAAANARARREAAAAGGGDGDG